MIPKTIHYCWFGNNPKPKLVEKCIRSWKKYCPDYTIIEWNESNFDINSNTFVKEAYASKKWAFVTDYVRLWAIYNFGGIYMDTDVEVTKKLDGFLKHSAFSGFESANYVSTGIMGGIKDHPVYGELLHYYDGRSFINSDGSLDTTTNTRIITSYFKEKGLLLNNSFQSMDDFTFYPSDVFCPKDPRDGTLHKTKNTYTIHHFDASWCSESDRKARSEWWKKQRLERIRYAPNRFVRAVLGDSVVDRIKSVIK